MDVILHLIGMACKFSDLFAAHVFVAVRAWLRVQSTDQARARSLTSFQPSPKKLSSLIAHRVATTPVRNTIPSVSRSARIRVSVDMAQIDAPAGGSPTGAPSP